MATALNVIFAGTPEFAAVSLQALLDSEHTVVAVYTQPDRPAGRGRKLTASPVKQLALQHQIAVRQPATLRAAAAQQELAQWQADVMVVAAYGLILPAAVLGIPRLGCINVHASILPRWRGAAPIQRAILAGDQETGITIMQMNAGLDTGDMLRVVSCPIGEHDTAQILHDRLASLGAQVLLETLTQLAAGQAQPVAQQDSLATYAGKLDKAEARLDWAQPAQTLDRQVRAFNPWPVAFTTLPGDEHLRIWQAEALVESASGAQPGKVIAQDKQGIDVATGQGVLRITRLQLPGGKPLSAAEFGNAHHLLGQQLQ